MASRERKRGVGALHCIPIPHPGEEGGPWHVNAGMNVCRARARSATDHACAAAGHDRLAAAGRGVPSPPQVERVKKLRHRGHPSASPGSVNSERRLVGLAIIMRPLAYVVVRPRRTDPPRRRSMGRAPPGQHMGERAAAAASLRPGVVAQRLGWLFLARRA